MAFTDTLKGILTSVREITSSKQAQASGFDAVIPEAPSGPSANANIPPLDLPVNNQAANQALANSAQTVMSNLYNSNIERMLDPKEMLSDYVNDHRKEFNKENSALEKFTPEELELPTQDFRKILDEKVKDVSGIINEMRDYVDETNKNTAESTAEKDRQEADAAKAEPEAAKTEAEEAKEDQDKEMEARYSPPENKEKKDEKPEAEKTEALEDAAPANAAAPAADEEVEVTIETEAAPKAAPIPASKDEKKDEKKEEEGESVWQKFLKNMSFALSFLKKGPKPEKKAEEILAPQEAQAAEEKKESKQDQSKQAESKQAEPDSKVPTSAVMNIQVGKENMALKLESPAAPQDAKKPQESILQTIAKAYEQTTGRPTGNENFQVNNFKKFDDFKTTSTFSELGNDAKNQYSEKNFPKQTVTCKFKNRAEADEFIKNLEKQNVKCTILSKPGSSLTSGQDSQQAAPKAESQAKEAPTRPRP